MRKIKSAAVALVLAVATVARADVLESVPDKALVALKIASLKKTSAKVAKLAKDFGIDALVPDLQDPLTGVKNASSISKGLNEDGEFALAFFDPKTLGVKEDDSLLAIIPVSDFKMFLTNFGDARTDGDVTEVALPHDTKPAYVADWNGYAAISPCKALVAKPTGTLKATGNTAKESARQDFLVYTNLKALSPLVKPDMDSGLTQALSQIENQTTSAIDPKYKPVLKIALTQLFAMGSTFMDNADSATVGLNISDSGLNYTVLSDFKPDSYLGKMASSFKGSEKALTTGLPVMRYLAYGGAAIDPTSLIKVIDDVTKPIEDEVKKIEGQEEVSSLIASFRTALMHSRSGAFAMPVSTNVGQEGIFQQITVYRDAGPEYKAAIEAANTFGQKALANMQPMGGRPKPTLEHKTNVKTISGVAFDSIKFDSKPAPDDPMAAQAEQMLNLFYGAEGMNYQYGVVGKDMLLSLGVSDANLGTVIKSLSANDEALAKLDQVKVVSAELPKVRLAEYYVAIDEWVNTGVSAAGQFGVPVQLQLPPELPPFGFTFGSDGSAMRFDAHIPSVTVQSLIAAGMQMYMQMQRGPAGAGGNL